MDQDGKSNTVVFQRRKNQQGALVEVIGVENSVSKLETTGSSTESIKNAAVHAG